MKELDNCTFVKTVLMLFVVFGHSVAFWSGTWFTEDPVIQSEGLKNIYGWISSFHIFSFTLVSGYIYAFKRSGGGYSKYLPFLKSKAKRLIIPYIFVMVIWVAPISAYFFNWDMSYIIGKYLLCINPSQLWFLWMLFGVFVISWPLWKVFSEKRLLGLTIVLLFYCIGFLGNMLLPNVFCIWTAFQYIIFFYIGIRFWCARDNYKGMVKLIPWWCWIILDIILYIIYVQILDYNGIMGKVLVIGLGFIINVVGAIMAFVVLQKIANIVNWHMSRGFQMLASFSMPMYLFHQQLIYFTIVLLNGKVNPWINASVNFIFAIAFSLLISYVLMKTKFTRILIGER